MDKEVALRLPYLVEHPQLKEVVMIVVAIIKSTEVMDWENQ